MSDPEVPQPPPGSFDPPAKSGVQKRTILIAVGALAAVVVGAVLLLGGGGGGEFDVTGTMTLHDSGAWNAEFKGNASVGLPCTGDGGFSDMRPGAQVRVTDARGELLAVGSLDAGVLRSGSDCTFPFAVAGIAKGKDLYQFEVTSRGQISYSYDELEAQNFTVGLTLGD